MSEMVAVMMYQVFKIDALISSTVNSYPSGHERRHSYYTRKRRLPEAREAGSPQIFTSLRRVHPGIQQFLIL